MKKEINIFNYEAWLLDRLEGKISPEDDVILSNFLLQNPELDGDIEGLDLLALEAEEKNVSFDASKLKRFHPSQEEETLMIRAIEGLAEPSEMTALNNWLATDDILANHYEAYKLTKQIPDHSIVYPNKSSLRKRRLIAMPVQMQWLVAASFTGIVVALSLFLKSGEINQLDAPILAHNDEQIAEYNQHVQNEQHGRAVITSLAHEDKKDQLVLTEDIDLKFKNSKAKAIYAGSHHNTTLTETDNFNSKTHANIVNSSEDVQNADLKTLDNTDLASMTSLPRLPKFRSEGVHIQPLRPIVDVPVKPRDSYQSSEPVMASNETSLLNIAANKLKNDVPGVNRAYKSLTDFADLNRKIVSEEGLVDFSALKGEKEGAGEYAIRIGAFEIGIEK